MMMMMGVILHRASIASSELDFGGGRILKILRIVSPAVLIDAQGNAHNNMVLYFTKRASYLGFHIEQGTRHKAQGTRNKVQGTGYKVQGITHKRGIVPGLSH